MVPCGDVRRSLLSLSPRVKRTPFHGSALEFEPRHSSIRSERDRQVGLEPYLPSRNKFPIDKICHFGTIATVSGRSALVPAVARYRHQHSRTDLSRPIKSLPTPVESTFTQVLILKDFKPRRIRTYKIIPGYPQLRLTTPIQPPPAQANPSVAYSLLGTHPEVRDLQTSGLRPVSPLHPYYHQDDLPLPAPQPKVCSCPGTKDHLAPIRHRRPRSHPRLHPARLG